MAEDRNYPVVRLPPDQLAVLERALIEGPVRLPDKPPSDVPTGLDARLLEAIIREKVALFLTAEQIEKKIDDAIEERLRNIGLPIDKDHVDATAEAVRSAMKWHKRVDKVAAGMAIAVLTAIGYALLGLVGIKLPQSGPG